MTGCWEWTAKLSNKGYGVIGDKKKMLTAHRASYELHNGKIPNGLWVRHKCDNRKCVNPNHLELGLPIDNSRDMYARGRNRHARYEDHPHSKLTWDIVKEIKSTPKKYGSGRRLAKKFNVTESVICAVRNGKIWIKYE